MSAAADIPDELVDLAYEAMSAELSHWSIIGPLEDRRSGNLPVREFWNAVRTEQSSIDAAPQHEITHLKSRQYAVACVQWHGLKAAIAALMAHSDNKIGGREAPDKGELGPIPSSNDGDDHG